MLRALALLLVLTGPVAAPPAAAQDAASARRAAEAERAAAAQAAHSAREAAAQEARLAAERIAGASRVQAAEREAQAAAGRAETARRAGAAALAEQARLAAEIAPMVPLLMRLATQPGPLLLAAPMPPADVAIGLAGLRVMLRDAEVKARLLREMGERAAMEAASLAREQGRLAAAEEAARQASAALDRQLDHARRLFAERSAAERGATARAEQAVQRARSLEEALARLERQRAEQARREAERERREEERDRREAARPRSSGRVPVPAPLRTAPDAAGALPVAGALVRDFNAPGEGGPSRGLTFAAQPGARVTAPCSGSVAFAAPFRSYGRMVILDCGGGQHLVLAGMERLDVAGGQRVRSGEPVGVLPAAPRPTLYMELRRRGEAVDPRPWLRAGA
ncbi:hypothetical protein EJV46_12140 [Roseococcus sp. SYP-B2431]|uniref:murein hydrolase activator EnvC family protein n=1 Tax=Roseococcus sp. SYP-B2431 TaxID=2496640 RepID=UPI00103B8F26|nr:peptidoglycan DD-metalloendopeptidase family protein [Roseococcus sp. SYP-B2431]TCH97959.1 hypothetical protein EJV46_12140 [Roseococcus sp. SYP-B2431]